MTDNALKISKGANTDSLTIIKDELDRIDEARAIPDYQDYLATSDGKIWSKKSNRFLIGSTEKNIIGGYKKVNLTVGGIMKNFKVHILVAKAFGIYKKGMQINHIDGNKTNNAISNLECCTRTENINHAFKNGLIIPKTGEHHSCAKLKQFQVDEIRSLYKRTAYNKSNAKELAEKYGVTTVTITGIIKNKIWKTGSNKSRTQTARDELKTLTTIANILSGGEDGN